MTRLATRAVHVPSLPPGLTVPAAPSLDFASAHFVPDLDVLDELARGRRVDGYYRRYGHRVGRQLEGVVRSLEGGEDAVALSSGMTAAISMFWPCFPRGRTASAAATATAGPWPFF